MSSESVAPLSTALKWLNHISPSILLLGGLLLYFLISCQNACGSGRAAKRFINSVLLMVLVFHKFPVVSCFFNI